MDKEDIIRMAREALKEDDGEDYYAYTHQIPHWLGKEDEILKFAELVAAAEREACAVIAFNAKTYLEAAAAIRARGKNNL
jgi:ABC-type sugar transport system substrate-binding protein